LHARARRVVWLNPLLGDSRYEPTARGMAAALPYVDVFAAAHNLESLERLVPRLSAAGPGEDPPDDALHEAPPAKGEDMMPGAFDYHAPGSLAEAIELLGRYGDAKVLSGGQSLLPLLKLRLGSAGHLIDINRVPGLEYIKEEGGFLRIGGRTRETALEASELIHERYPILADTASVIADPIVRNLATIGGNLAHGDPANDHPA